MIGLDYFVFLQILFCKSLQMCIDIIILYRPKYNQLTKFPYGLAIVSKAAILLKRNPAPKLYMLSFAHNFAFWWYLHKKENLKLLVLIGHAKNNT